MSNPLDVLYEAIANRNSDHFSSDDRWLEFLDMVSIDADLIAAVLRAAEEIAEDPEMVGGNRLNAALDALKAALTMKEG